MKILKSVRPLTCNSQICITKVFVKLNIFVVLGSTVLNLFFLIL
jgi:hypothetical protein